MSRYLEYCSSWRKRQNQSKGLLLSYGSWKQLPMQSVSIATKL